MKTRVCNICKRRKRITSFYTDSNIVNGYSGHCKKCNLAKSRKYYLLSRKKRLKYAAKYRRDNIDQVTASVKRAHANNPKSVARSTAVYKKRHKHKIKARRILYQALLLGKVIRGVCEKCGLSKVDAHHEDYTKPLKVRWFCRRHHMELHRKVFLSLAFLFLLSGCAGQFDLVEENDYFQRNNKDNEYTQGLTLRYTEGDESFALTQQIYTPTKKQVKELIPNDRPYAGWLYGEYQFKYKPEPFTEDTFGLRAGVVGPSALGGEAQNEVHRNMGIPTAKGWANQLHDEPGLILSVKRSVKSLPFTFFGADSDFITTIGANLGNVETSLLTGAILRVGVNLPDTYGPEVISPRIKLPENKKTPFYVFFGPLGRYVARDIFIQGNTFRDSHRVTMVPLVADLKLGFATELYGVKFSYSYVLVTQQFAESNPVNAYGSLDIGFGY